MKRGLLTAALGAALLVPQAGAQAPAAKPPVALNAADTMQKNLEQRVGEKVELVMNSGQSLKGTLKAVGAGGVHLTALEGKEYYDALVRLDQVGAIVVRAK